MLTDYEIEKIAARVAEKLQERSDNELLTLKEASEYLKTSKAAIQKRVERGQIKVLKFGKSSYIRRRDIILKDLSEVS